MAQETMLAIKKGGGGNPRDVTRMWEASLAYHNQDVNGAKENRENRVQ